MSLIMQQNWKFRSYQKLQVEALKKFQRSQSWNPELKIIIAPHEMIHLKDLDFGLKLSMANKENISRHHFNQNYESSSNTNMLNYKANYYIKNLEIEKNLIFVTHYVFISEVLNYGPSSGEIVVSDKNLNIIGSVEIDF